MTAPSGLLEPVQPRFIAVHHPFMINQKYDYENQGGKRTVRVRALALALRGLRTRRSKV